MRQLDKQEEVLTELLRMRLMDMEYDQITVDDIRQVYMEETGEELSVSIEVFKSDDYIDTGQAYGFNGTIIHFFDEVQGINQLYTIARGSEPNEGEEDWRPIDWAYNLMGIFVGGNVSQYRAAEQFDSHVTVEVMEKSEIETLKIGLGHSLGGNIITQLQLVVGSFDNIHTVNAAAPSYYQLAEVDIFFKRKLTNHFNINANDPYAIYFIDPDELQEFAEDYYKEAGENIEHITAKQDFLQALSSIRGFFSVGTYHEPIDAFPGEDIESISILIEQLPDELIKDIQLFLAENYAEIYNADGFDGLIRALTGIEPELIDEIIEFQTTGFRMGHIISFPLNLVKSLRNVKNKLPKLLTLLKGIQKHLPNILPVLVEHGYLSKNDSKALSKELVDLIGDLNGILKSVNEILTWKNYIGIGGNAQGSLKIGQSISSLIAYYQSVQIRWDSILEHTEYLRDQFSKAAQAHSIYSVVMNGPFMEAGRAYTVEGSRIKDVIIDQRIDGEEISVNISSSTRIYIAGMEILEEKSRILQRMISNYENTYLNDYDRRKKEIKKKITDMEDSPGYYQELLGPFTADTNYFYRLTRIDVHDDIKTLEDEEFQRGYENMFTYIEKIIKNERELLEQIKTITKRLFEEEEKIVKEILS